MATVFQIGEYVVVTANPTEIRTLQMLPKQVILTLFKESSENLITLRNKSFKELRLIEKRLETMPDSSDKDKLTDTFNSINSIFNMVQIVIRVRAKKVVEKATQRREELIRELASLPESEILHPADEYPTNP